ncbi:MAG TPA: DUF3450 domain-containing protein [Candidatus Limnocylindrales bacterium]|nr:DUF3450 domain-containing protein [Candidatus Limnocylindrales bacterium]
MRHDLTISGLTLACALMMAPAAGVAADAATGPAVPPAAAASSTPPATDSTAAKPASTELLERARAEQKETYRADLAAQQRIDQLDEETQRLLSEYRKALADAESHASYAAQLEKQVASQSEELAGIQTRLDEVEATARSVTPLMQRMLATLRQFVELDIPFLVEERRNRVAVLEGMMDRADVTISEKYRRIIEAYQVEMDYGRTIEAYEAKLTGADDAPARTAGDEARTAKFLRIGRVSLLYQTLDGKETGYWDTGAGRWVVDNDYAHAFKEGVAVALKLRAPEMLLAPVPAPVEVRS